jgi:Tol biopolymer transport system component
LEAPINGVDFNCPLEQDHMAFYKLDPVRGVGKQAAEISTSSASEPTWSVSPDGSRVAVTDSRMLAGQVRILNLTNSTDHVISLVPHWHVWDVTWAADGNSLFAMASQDPDLVILQIELNGKTHVIINQGRAHLLEFPRLSPDGRHLAFSQLTWESNAWLLENF